MSGVQRGVGSGVSSRSWGGGRPLHDLGARVQREEPGGAADVAGSTPIAAGGGFFEPSGRIYTLNLMLRGANLEGGTAIRGKTLPKVRPRWESSISGRHLVPVETRRYLLG